ncbi:hypothetical protein ACFY5D_21820 [Paeniglutamicibacter sp. NPDC012692]|uniref:glycan biosynthesis hexose transferase WsfD n=1 Tax=Paeniglutamicibacter sp. NPDC012692 TaxID=3364388 RepID=UPI0036AE8AAE
MSHNLDPSRLLFSRAIKRIGSFFAPGSTRNDGRVNRIIPALTGLFSTAFILFRLFYPTTVGMGDQGDGRRLVCPLGLSNVRPWDYGDFTSHIFPSWVEHQWYGEACGADGSGEPYYSSQTLILWPAKYLTRLLGWGNGLDTRAVAIICAMLFGILTAAFINLLPGRASFRVIIALLITLVTADGIFSGFFVSAYSEPAAFLGVYAIMVSLLFWWRRPRLKYLSLFMVIIFSAFTIAAKTQTASFIPVIVLALCWQPFKDAAAKTNSKKSKKTVSEWGAVRRFAPAFIALVLLGSFTLTFSKAQPERFTELNLYNAVFTEMLPHSPTPEEDLEWFGLDPSFIESKGTTVASTNAAVYNSLYEQFFKKVSLSKIGVFYVTHPDRLPSMATRGLQAMTQPELQYLGSFEAGTGHEAHEKERRVPVVLNIFESFQDSAGTLFLIQILTWLMGFGVAIAPKLGAGGQAVGRLAIVFIPAIWLQFWAVMMTEGQSEIYKHLIIAGYMTALCMPLLVALILIRFRRSKPESKFVRRDAANLQSGQAIVESYIVDPDSEAMPTRPANELLEPTRTHEQPPHS